MYLHSLCTAVMLGEALCTGEACYKLTRHFGSFQGHKPEWEKVTKGFFGHYWNADRPPNVLQKYTYQKQTEITMTQKAITHSK